MSVINTNVSALYAQNAMKTNSRVMSTTMEQLSTGTRVNSAKDDAAGLAIGQNMTSQIRGLNQAVRNANDGVNLLQTAEGSLVEQTNMLQRMRELSVQSSNASYSDTQRGYLNTEYAALSTQMDNIASQTSWNGQKLLDASGGDGTGSYVFQVGQNDAETVTVDIAAMASSDLLTDVEDISTAAGASTAIGVIDTALDTINSQRATIGAGINQLTYAADNLTNISANVTASRSSIIDTDYATASTQLAKSQIIQQAATAMLAQANQQPQSVLALLK